MRAIGKVIGYVMWIGAGLLMFGFWMIAMSKWLGFIGTVLGIIFSPGLVIFPIVFWIVEGTFPAFYFIVWGLGLVGLLIAGLSTEAN